METKASMTATEIIPQLVDLLSKLTVEDRQRAVSAAMILLGQVPVSTIEPLRATANTEAPEGISQKAVAWMRKYSITETQLENVFSISENEVDVIAAKMPADSKRQQTVESYLVCGIADLIRNGEGKFSDKDARALCQKVGCYDRPNHTNYMKAVGNLLTGSKDAGWKLTNPGFERAAKLIQQLAPSNA